MGTIGEPNGLASVQGGKRVPLLCGVCVLGCQLVGCCPLGDGFTRCRSGTKKVFLLGRIRHESAGSEEEEHLDEVIAQF